MFPKIRNTTYFDEIKVPVEIHKCHVLPTYTLQQTNTPALFLGHKLSAVILNMGNKLYITVLRLSVCCLSVVLNTTNKKYKTKVQLQP